MKKPFAHRALAASAILGLSLAGLTACSAADPAQGNAPTPAVSSSAAEAKAEPTVDPKLVAAQERNAPTRKESIKLLKADGIVVTDKLISTPDGKFPMLEVSKDSKYAKFTSEKHENGLPKGWTYKDADAAQRFGMNFMLQDIWDSTIHGMGKVSKNEVDAWNVHTSKKMTKELKNVKGYDRRDKTTPWMDWDDFKAAGYTYLYDESTPRIRSVNLKKKRSVNWEGGMFFEYAGTIDWNASTDTKPGIVENIKVKQDLTVKKVNGKFLVDSWDSRWDTDDEFLRAGMNDK